MEGDFMWAVQQMKEGKKIRRKCWNNNQYIHTSNDAVLWNNGINPKFRLKQFEAIDWEIVEESLPKVFLGKEIHPEFIKKDDDKYYLKEEIDKRLKEFINWLHKSLDRYSNDNANIDKEAKRLFG